MNSLFWALAGLLVLSPSPARAAEEDLSAYKLIAPAERLPEQPWHDNFIDESHKTPDEQPNAGAAGCNFFLEKSLADQLQRTAANSRWESWPPFLSCAVWGYLSPDSRFQKDERLLAMTQKWLDTLFVALSTRPENPKADENWHPNKLDTWIFHEYTIPLLEIEKRTDLRNKIGLVRVSRFREIVIDNIRRATTPDAYNKLMEDADKYINIITHPMAVFIHGWLLTGEKKYLLMAYRIIHTLGRDQLPNGMFPYAYPFKGEHFEYEGMYYHAINIRALYLYWWATGSSQAEAILRKSIAYYPLNMEPPYFLNDGANIWWKDQWRTFWPHHIAMVAAATGDGENATIANAMARNDISFDRVDLILGAHAYLQIGLSRIREKPQRTNYLLEDPDIRGVRLRFQRWSSTFTTGSYTYTRASAMNVDEDLKSYSALHMARPYVRVAAMDKPYRTEPDYGTLGREGADYVIARAGRVAAIATTYSPSLTAATWNEQQPMAPWKMQELWLMTDQGMLGILTSTTTTATAARELCHQFRFIVSPKEDEGTSDNLAYSFGGIRFRVWATDLPFRIRERVRRYALGERDRSDSQICLSDTNRDPEHLVQDMQEPKKRASSLVLPDTRTYPNGYQRFSLVEISPSGSGGFRKAKKTSQGNILAFRTYLDSVEYLALFNTGESEARYEMLPARHVKFVVNSGGSKAVVPATAITSLKVPRHGVALLSW